MFDPRITKHVETAVRLKASEFNHAISTKVREINAEAARNHQMGSARTVLRCIAVFREELDRRARCVFDEIKRALILYRPQFDETLAAALVDLLMNEADRQCLVLKRAGRFDRPAAEAFGPSIASQVESALVSRCSRVRERYTFEIGNLVHELRHAAAGGAGPSGPSIVVHGNVGALQTGPNATASVAMTIGGAEREALLKALDMIGGALRDAEQIAAVRRDELLDVVAQAKAAARQPSPNVSLLHGMFYVLCTTLQAIASARPAVDALIAAAGPLGIGFAG